MNNYPKHNGKNGVKILPHIIYLFGKRSAFKFDFVIVYYLT